MPRKNCNHNHNHNHNTTNNNLTGSQASRQALGILLNNITKNDGQLSEKDLEQIQRLSMIENLATRQEQFLEMSKKEQTHKMLWENINQIFRYLTIPGSAYLTYQILHSFKNLSNIIAYTTLKVITTPFIMVIDIMVALINKISNKTSYLTWGWVGSHEQVISEHEGDYLVGNFTYSMVNNKYMTPILNILHDHEWDVYLLAFISLYLVIIIIVNFTRLWISANRIWTPIGGISCDNTDSRLTTLDRYLLHSVNSPKQITVSNNSQDLLLTDEATDKE